MGRGGATTFAMDMQHADAVMIMGSNMAECHPVAFRWVMKAKANSAKVMHIDPRFTRTSAMAKIYSLLRAGSDIGPEELVNYILAARAGTRAILPRYVGNYTMRHPNPSDYQGPEDMACWWL
jgi:formate dehydrogenase major subunit